MTTPWLRALQQRVVGALREGTPVATVAQSLALDSDTVRRWGREAGVAPPHRYVRYTCAFREAVVDRVAQGEAITEVARSVGVSKGQASLWCQNAGVQSQHPIGPPRVTWHDVLMHGRVIERVRRVGDNLTLSGRVIGTWGEVERCRSRESQHNAGRGRWCDGPAATPITDSRRCDE
jgi:transposase-like protein